MGTTYTGLKIKNTYGAIIKVGDNSNLTAFEKQLSDGLGNNTGLYVGTNNRLGIGISPTEALHVSGNIKSTATVEAVTFSGDLNGTINTATTGVTQSAGDNSTKIATTAYVDSITTAQDVDFSGTTGTGSVDLDSQTFAIIGTSNEIETSASSQTLTIGLPNDVTIGNDLTVTNDLDVTGVITTAGVTEQATQFLFTKDLKVHDAIPTITLSDSDSAGASALGDIVWIDSGATQKAIISLSSSNLGITSKAGELQFGTNSTNALTIDTSQNATFAADLTVGGVLKVINTSDPANLVEVTVGDPTTAGDTTVGGILLNGGAAKISITQGESKFGITAGDGGFIYNNQSATTSALGIGTLTNASLVLGTNDTARLTITGSGAATFASDLTVGAELEFGSLTSTTAGATIGKFVTEAQGIASNDNDTSVPTSAAVKDYVDTNVTAQDLDFSGTSGTGSVDLDSQTFAVVGTTNEIETTAGSQQLQIGLPNDVTIGNDLTVTGTLNASKITITSKNFTLLGDSVAIGENALEDWTSGQYLIAIGKDALKDVTDAHSIIGIGRETMERADSYCIGIGQQAGKYVEGLFNIAIGNQAMGGVDGSTDGDYNIAIGNKALGQITSGDGNTVVGMGMGTYTLTTGDDNIYIGRAAANSAVDVENEIVIGAGVTGKGSNTVLLGTGDTTAWLPYDDNGVDLGSSALSFKDAHIQGALNGGSATFAGNVRTGTSSLTANTNFDNLVIEGSAHTGITIFSGTSSDGGIYFGDSGANNLGQIKYLHSSNAMTFATNDGSASLTLDSGLNATFAGGVTAGGNVDVSGSVIARANASYYSTRTYLGDTWEFASDTTDGVTFKITGGAANTTGNYFRFQTQAGGATADTKLIIDKSGNVGIGTDSPQSHLHISTSGTNSAIRLQNDNGSGSTANFVLQTDSSGLGNNGFGIYDVANSSYRLVIDGSGNVGIGTTSPSTKLHIEGASSGYLQTIKNTTAGGDYLQMLAETGDAVFEFDSGGTGGEATLNMYRDGTQYVKISADAGVHNYFNNGANVGIGTASPDAKLDVNGATYVRNVIYGYAGAGNQYGGLSWGGTDEGFLFLKDSNVTKVNINSNGDSYLNGGNVGIGTSTFAPTVTNQLKIGNMGSGVVGEIYDAGLAAGAAQLILCTASGSGVVPVISGRHYSAAYGYDIWMKNTTPWNVYFDARGQSQGFIWRNYTNNNGGEVELMKIDGATGHIFICSGSYSTGSKGKQFESNPNTVDLKSSTSSTSLEYHQEFANPNSTVGSITTSGSATAFNTSSDYRLKEDLKDFDGLDKVSNIKVYNFKWKVDENRSYGVLAHELAEVLPQAVNGEKDAEKMQGVDYSKIVPLLVKSIQELKAEIETLKTQINK